MTIACIYLSGIAIGWFLRGNFTAQREADRAYRIAKLERLLTKK